MLSPCLFNSYAEHILEKCWLDELQTGIKIGGRNINNLRYADYTTLMSETKEELKHLLMKMKEESERPGLKINIKKTKIMASSPTTSRQIEGEKVEVVTDFLFLDSVITVDGDCSHEISRRLLLDRIAITNLNSLLKKQRHHFDNKGLYSQGYGLSSSHTWL